ncbi:AraC family transcriptional regulator [Proteiniphilum sp.]|uniref:helix-turn-helix domain-containing protein n=1 Tax=Proteiniphilum sp. TaxID=1926877 RepID=UPI002B2114EE|nr:AraC family transcriptional regulator [Proteiniphilum sp.]MEA4916355.1 AraC family transcriptional regulator [Proteiniphilum sp.]MEA4950951.1 AraC family transcriptional regulator [Petrimonas sp.]
MNENIIPLHTFSNDDFVHILRIEDAEEFYFESFHRHDFYQILLFDNIAENGQIFIDTKQFPILEERVYIILPGQIHSMRPANKKGWGISLSKDFFFSTSTPKLQRAPFVPMSSSLNSTVMQAISGLVQLIVNEYRNKNRYQLMDIYLKAFFFQVCPFMVINESKNVNDLRILQLLDLIEQHYVEHKDCAFYADCLSVSKKRVNELTKTSVGKTVKQLLQERLVSEIKREIMFGQCSLKEISYQLGFNEPSYFTRFFKKHTCLTPEEYKSSKT